MSVLKKICCLKVFSTRKLEINTTENSNWIPVYWTLEQDKKIAVCSLPTFLSQSGVIGKKSYACVLISLEVARLIDEHELKFPLLRKVRKSEEDNTELIHKLVHALTFGMHRGNRIYIKAIRKGKLLQTETRGVTIPEAIEIGGHQFKEISYVTRVYGYIFEKLPIYLRSAIQWSRECENLSQLNHLYFLIIIKKAATLLVYQQPDEIIGFVDSHTHNISGALLAYTTVEHLASFCRWIVYRIFPETLKYLENEQHFELSLLLNSRNNRRNHTDYCNDIFPLNEKTEMKRICRCDWK